MSKVSRFHGATKYWFDSLGSNVDYSEQFYGSIGVVEGFGCVVVGTYDMIEGKNVRDLYFDEKDVEV